MTKATNRRAVLGGVLAACAAGTTAAIPAVAQPLIGEDHPDAALLALGPEIEAADRKYELCEHRGNVAEDVFISIKPEQPVQHEIVGFPTPQAVYEMLRQGRQDELDYWHAELQKRDAALKAWKEIDLPRARVESGLDAAENAVSEADNVRLTIRDEKLIPTPARTLEGLIFKARYAASHFETDYDEGVMISIVDDLLALGDEMRT